MHKYTVVISSEAERAVSVLKDSFDVITLPPDVTVDTPVRCHADMILFTLGNSAVLPASYAGRYPYVCDALASLTGCDVIFDCGERSPEYPFDVGLNVLTCSSAAFSLVSHTSEAVKELLREKGIKHVNVKQGYAACSTLSLGVAVITADEGIARATLAEGIETLLIGKGAVRLDGYGEGFIGGASGVCEDVIYFLGNIDSHPDSKNIRTFAERFGYECVSLFDGELCDFGGIRFLRNRHHASDKITQQLP